MECPEDIKRCLAQRREHANRVSECDDIIAVWLEQHGMSINDERIKDHIATNALEISTPNRSAQAIMDYIEDHEG